MRKSIFSRDRSVGRSKQSHKFGRSLLLTRKRLGLFLLAVLMTSSSLFSLFVSTPRASAISCPTGVVSTGVNVNGNVIDNCAAQASTFTPSQEVESLSFYTALDGCLDNGIQGDIDSITEGSLVGTDSAPIIGANGGWFNDPVAGSYYVFPNGSGSASVSEPCKTIASQALAFWNITPIQFLQMSGYTFVQSDSNSRPGWHSAGPPNTGTVRAEDYESSINQAVYNGDSKGLFLTPTLSAPATYQMDLTMFQGSTCSGDNLGAYDSASATYQSQVGNNVSASIAGISSITSGQVAFTKINLVTPDKIPESDIFAYYAGTPNQRETIAVVSSTSLYGSASGRTSGRGAADTITCSALATKLNKDTAAYIEWLSLPANSGATVELATLKPADTPTSTSCVITGVGWIICSMAKFIAQVTDGIYSLIAQLLQVPPINTDTSSTTNGIYSAWVIMRNFANVAFVLVFLIIVFSQLTNLGVSNYGVKKALPRLVVAAILVNTSFFVSALAVDISNILGSGLYVLFQNISNSISLKSLSNWSVILPALLSGGSIGLGTASVVGGAVAIVALVATPEAGMAILFLAIPLVLSALLAVFLAIFVLVARQAFIIILIVISPLAFVALLLPNTEKLFTKWRQYLTTLLLLYPIMSIIFGGAQVAGLVITASAGNSTSSGAMIAILTGQIIMVVPFFFIITLITKFGGGNLDKVAGNRASRGKGLIGGASNASNKEGKARLGRGFERAKYGGAKFDKNGKEKVGSSLRRGLIGGLGRRYDQQRDSESSTDGYLKELRGKATTDRLASDSDYATKSAAGSVSDGQLLRDRAVASAEAGELKKALEPLSRAIAAARTQADPQAMDKLLYDQAIGGSTQAEKSAAMHEASRLGRDEVVNALRTNSGFADRLPPVVRDATAEAEQQRLLQAAIGANSAGLLVKAPDLVKGNAAAAFANAKGEEVAGYTAGTGTRQVEYISKLKADMDAANLDPTTTAAAKADLKNALDKAVSSFNTSIEDIKINTTLQAKFGGDTGKAMLKAASGLDASLQAQLTSLSNIDSSTGKIRP